MRIRRAFAAATIPLIAFFSLNALAVEVVRWSPSPEHLAFAILYDQEGKFFVDQFLKEHGRLQERIATNSFATIEEAIAEFDRISVGYDEKSPEDLRQSFATGELPTDGIWEVTQSWSNAWETKYTEWINANATPDFFLVNGISTDCADVAYAYRWIFARIHGLSAANTLAGTGELLTQESVHARWQSLPKDPEWQKDQRFIAALNYLLENTFTHTLMPDMYPVAINRQSLVGGAVHLNLYTTDSGHTEFISRVLLQHTHPYPIQIIASTVPREVRSLDEYGFNAWGGDFVENVHALVRFRWPIKNNQGQWVLKDRVRMPDYSLEQFAPDFASKYSNLNEAIMKRLMPQWAPDVMNALQSQITLFKRRLVSRVTAVENGFRNCQRIDCSPGSAGWENWSTPSRDRTLMQIQKALVALYEDSACGSACTSKWTNELPRTITRIDGTEVTIGGVVDALVQGALSFDPRDSLKKRWGLE